MKSIIVKIHQEGDTDEYVFQGLGPVKIGHADSCDLRLHDETLPNEILEVKFSGGLIQIHVLCSNFNVLVNDSIVPPLKPHHLKKGDVVYMQNQNVHFSFDFIDDEAIAPPPYSTDDFQNRLESLGQTIKTKELELTRLQNIEREKEQDLLSKEALIQDRMSVLRNVQNDINLLLSKKEMVAQSLSQQQVNTEEESFKIQQIQDRMTLLGRDEANLIEQIQKLKSHVEKLTREQQETERNLSQFHKEKKDKETIIHQLNTEYYEIEKKKRWTESELQKEAQQIKQILTQSDLMNKERVKIQKMTQQLLLTKEQLEIDIHQKKSLIQDLSRSRENHEKRILELKREQFENEEEHKLISDKLQHLKATHDQLKRSNEDLRMELLRVEEKLSSKKNQANEIDFRMHETQRKITELQNKQDQIISHIHQLEADELSLENKVTTLRREQEIFHQKFLNEQAHYNKIFEDEKLQKQNEILILKTESLNLEEQIKTSEAHLKSVEDNLIHSVKKMTELQSQELDLKSQFHSLNQDIKLLSEKCQRLKDQELQLFHQKQETENALSLLKIKHLDLETLIDEKQKSALLELENLKREERSKIASERVYLQNELEATKQKQLRELEEQHQHKLEEIHKQKSFAQKQYDEIIERARKIENELISKATARLSESTEHAKEREAEAHRILREAQQSAHKIKQEIESDITGELENRKKKIKNFLNEKHHRGVEHIRRIHEAALTKVKKEEQRSLDKIEAHKRKELKKAFLTRWQEIEKYSQSQDKVIKEITQEKEKQLAHLNTLKKKQEQELTETKKAFLEHMNQSKIQAHEALQNELKRIKDDFEESRRARIQNAIQATTTLFVTEFNLNSLNDTQRERLEETLKTALEGVNAQVKVAAESTLHLSQHKRKQIIPVLKKYSLRAAPAVAALLFMLDVASMRSSLFSFIARILETQQKASDLFVENQKQEFREKYTYNPESTTGYKSTYTDNVIYTTHFMNIVEDEGFQNDWILKLHDFMVQELELSEDIAINYISAESSLIKELQTLRNDLNPQFLDQGLQKMRDLEKKHLGWVDEKIADEVKRKKFEALKKSFFESYEKSFKLADKKDSAPIKESPTPSNTAVTNETPPQEIPVSQVIENKEASSNDQPELDRTPAFEDPTLEPPKPRKKKKKAIDDL